MRILFFSVIVLALLASLKSEAQPANNNFANAIPLTGAIVTTTGSNVGANKEGREPSHGGNGGGASVWWTWAAPASGLTTIDTFGSSFNTLLGVYTGTSFGGFGQPGLTTIAGNDDYNGNQWSRVQFTAVAGTLYRIAVDGFRQGFFGTAAQGSIVLNIQGPAGVTITSPTNGMQFIVGDAIPLAVDISTNFPNQPVARVDFYRGGIVFASSTNAPFSALTTNSPPGSNSFLAVAFDSLGQPHVSPAVIVLVLNNGITIVSPADGTYYANTNPITVSALSHINSGFNISEVNFYADGQQFGQATASPFSATWSNVVSGAHKFIAIGQDADGNEFVSTPVFVSVAGMVVQSNAVWKYLDDGSDQGTSWIAPAFDDSTWASGPAPLGYADANGQLPATTNSYGPDPTNRFTTTYYRSSFVATNNYAFLTMRVQRDDGAIVYLNGSEVFRLNMPTGAVTYTTFASSAISGTGETTWYSTNVNPQLLRLGTNVLAAEVHQVDLTNADLWFDLDLGGYPLIVRNQLPLAQLTVPTDGDYFLAPSSVLLTATANDPDGSVAKVEFYADGAKLGETNNTPYTVVWNAPPIGWHTLQAVATDNEGARGASDSVGIIVYDSVATPLAQVTGPPGGQIFYGPTNVTITAVAASANGVANVEFRANGAAIGSATTPPYGIVWTNAAYGTNALTAVVLDGAGASSTSAVVNIAVLTNDAPVVAITSPADGSAFLAATNISVLVSATDGQGVAKVEFYANATKLGQDASSPYTFAWNNLAAGNYQLWAVATDIYGLAATSPVVNISVTNDAPPVVSITAPANGAPFNTPANIAISVDASDVDGTIGKVEFFGNGAKLGENATSPFSFTWSNVLTTGSVPVYAVATDNLGFRGTSAVVNISITALVSPQWGAFNDQNKGTASGPNDTFYTASLFGNSSGPLKDSYTGAVLPVSLAVTNNPGVTNAPTMSAPAVGTPAYTIFNGYIDWNSGTSNGFHVFPTNTIGYRFTGLDPLKQYVFIGTSVRGGTAATPGNEYSNRWTQLELSGALSYTPAHSSNVVTAAQYPADLTGSQAAFNAGVNSTATTGDVVEWDNIVPAADGTFTVLCTKYNGAFPGGSAANGQYTFALTAIKLAIQPFGISSQPQSLTVTPGDTATFRVTAAGTPPLFYQWLKNGTNINGATNRTYAILFAGSGDQGIFSVVVSNLTTSALSSNATLLVGNYPIVITNQPQDQVLVEGSIATLSVGFSGASPYRFQWYKDGVPLTGATNQNLVLPNVTTADMAPYFVLVSDRFSSDISSEAQVSVFSPSAPAVTVLRFSDSWRYNQSGSDLGTTWTDPSYDDGSWSAGQGVLAKTTAIVPEPVNTVLSLTNGGLAVTSFCFRTHFNWPFPTTNVFLMASNLVDDGAVYYVNGVELARLRVAAGAVSSLTTATNAVNNGTNYEVLSLSSAVLVEGDNVLAVEVHQAAASGSDVVFGMNLKAMARSSELAHIALSPVDRTANEGQSASFSAEVFGTPPFVYQWYKDNQALAGATNLSLLLPVVHGSNQGVYTLWVANRFNSAFSDGAALTVIRDLTAPTIVSAIANDLTKLMVTFSEPVDPASALNTAYYTFNPGLIVLGVQMINSTTVLLTTSPRDVQFDYTLALNGVQDFAVPPNTTTGANPARIHRRNSSTLGGLGGIQTVFFIIFENQDWSAIYNNANAPYFNSLLPQASWTVNYHAVNNQHPSEPSYIQLEGGTNFGYTTDNGPSIDRISTTNHLSTYLNNAGIDWRGYMEDLPAGNVGTNTTIGEYVGRHNPFSFFNDVTSDYSYCTNHVRPYSYFAADLASGQIGRYNWISPNLTNDMHDLAPGSSSQVHQGDVWLSQELPKILNSAAYANNGAVFVTFDESQATTQNPIFMAILSPLAKGGGYQSTNFYDHNTTVHTMQDIFGVYPYLAGAAAATNWSEMFLSPSVQTTIQNGITRLSLSSMPVGKINYVQASTDMIHWTTISLVAADAPNETITISDQDSAGSHSQRFYRVVEAP